MTERPLDDRIRDAIDPGADAGFDEGFAERTTARWRTQRLPFWRRPIARWIAIGVVIVAAVALFVLRDR